MNSKIKKVNWLIKIIFISCLVFGLTIIFATDTYGTINTKQSVSSFYERINFSTGPNFDRRKKCVLAQVDPWDPQLLPHLQPDWNPLKNCSITRLMHTELSNGTIRMLDNTTSECKYRCLYKFGELNFKTSNWTEMKKNELYRENCDFIETHCTKENKTTFRYIHVQVIKSAEKHFQEEDELHPSVFIFILDSTSVSSAMRTIVETNEVLRRFYDATTFYYHNKVGINSRPNAYAIFSGTRISELNKHLFPDKFQSEHPNSCKEGVKMNETITYDFVEQNYASIIAEDWIGAFNWPNCIGYSDPPTDHYGSPLLLRTADGNISKKDKNDFDTHFYKGECHERYHKLMDFFDKFLVEYNGISKFMIMWTSLITHNSASGLYHTDKYFANFFRKNVNKLNNSFIFLMADHGLRFGGIRRTSAGEIEDNNPLLTLAVPKYLRSNKQLFWNIKQNSRRHTCQYDIFATLYDIAQYARKNNFENWDEHNFREELGKIRGGTRAKSILRPISYDRTCEEMEIPEEYCICERIWLKSNISDGNVIKAGQFLITIVNDLLKKKRKDKLCATLQFVKVISAEHLEDQPILKVVIKASPSNGLYQAELLQENGSFKRLSKIRRLDRYSNEGYCAPDEDIRPLCYCRVQLTKTKIQQRLSPVQYSQDVN